MKLLRKICTALALLIWLLPLAAGLSSCRDSEDSHNSSYAKVYFFWNKPFFKNNGGEFFQLSNYASSVEENGLSYSIKQTGTNPDLELLAPNLIKIDNQTTMFNQCGTYDIVINNNGEVTRIEGLVYSGETNMVISRGAGWSMYISCENWKML